MHAVSHDHELGRDAARAAVVLATFFRDVFNGRESRATLSGLRFEDAARHLSDPLVAETFVTEALSAFSDNAEARVDFADDLLEQSPHSAGSNTEWVRGKALEEAGRTLDAETVFSDIIDHDATNELALYDLARFSSDRGDADRGLAFLRLGGYPSDCMLANRLQRFSPNQPQ